MKVYRTHHRDERFTVLVEKLNRELAERDGADHSFYSQFNDLDDDAACLVLVKEQTPLAIGVFRMVDTGLAEVKRMYVEPAYRGYGLAQQILKELELWGQEKGVTTFRLETGKRQPEAIRFYSKQGYSVIPNYQPYEGVENSVCFEKVLIKI